MGFELYCYICGGPLHNDGFLFKDIKKLNKYLKNIKSKKLYNNILKATGNLELFLFYINQIKNINENITNIKYYKKLNNIGKYKWLNKKILLHKSGKNIKVTGDTWEGEFYNKKNKYYVIWNNSLSNKIIKEYNTQDGIIIHNDCYKLMKTKYKNFNLYNIYNGKINYKKYKKYITQEVLWLLYFINNDDFILESPLKNKKNKERINKIKHFIKNKKNIKLINQIFS